jgi:hypothetical protein
MQANGACKAADVAGARAGPQQLCW